MATQQQKDKDPGANVGDATSAAHEGRVEVDRKESGLAEGQVVDARLDNRTGTYRPEVAVFPAVPQQIDGPDVMHQEEYTRAYLAKSAERVGERLGMFSPGPHGISPVEERSGRDRADESGGKPAPDGETGADQNQKVGETK